MTVKDGIRQLLEQACGQFLSGEQIAKHFSISRAAVWKAIASLRSDGYIINAVSNKGYSLSPESDVLTIDGICGFLDNKTELELELFDTVTSTNSLLRERAGSKAAEGKVIIANEQTSGRGRYKRSFSSPKGSGIYLSLLLRPEMSAESSTLITTAAAVAVCEAIEAVSDKKPVIKWVNDVFIDSKKVCGILTEAAIDMESLSVEYVVLGIGINVYEPQDGFPDNIKDIAGAVLKERRSGIKNQLTAEILNRFFGYYKGLTDRLFLPSYRSRCFILNQQVEVQKNGESTLAKALGIDDDCRLLLRFEDGSEKYLSSGEISVKI